jgi:hypothetical protein
MRFAIIGQSAEAVVLIDSIRAAGSHQLGACCVAGSLAAAMSERGIAFSQVASPEEAIIDSGIEVVVVAEEDVDRSMSLARQASQADCHVIVIPPDEVSTAYSFELHLLLDESQYGIIPLTGRWYMAADAAASREMEKNIQQLAMDLPLTDDAAELQRWQLRAVDALCGCGFEYTRVTALDVPGADGRLLSRSMTLAASDAADAQVPPGILTFRKSPALHVFTPSGGDGESGTVSRAQLLVTTTDGEEHSSATALPDPAGCEYRSEDEALVMRLVAHLADRDQCQRHMEQFSNTLEMVAGLQKSLRRRRTVDVYFDGISERSAFKTQMTAIGCGVLTYVIFGMVGFLIMAKLTDLPPLMLQIARIAWIAPVVIFLLAQFLLPLARERRKSD